MEFTSGGGSRDRLDATLASSDNNVYGLLYSDASNAKTVAESFIELGWSARKASWDEFEVTNEWCSFIVGSSGGQLKLAGVVAPERLDDLGAAFAAAGQTYSLELYDGNDLVREASG